MNAQRRLATPIGVLLTLVSCSPPVPKAYGVYAREGRQLTDLTDQTAAKTYQLSPQARIIVFDRELADPGFAPGSRLQLFRSNYVRNIRVLELDVAPRVALELINRGPEKVLASEVANIPVVFSNVTASGAWANDSDPVRTRIEPLGEHRDMLALVPAAPLTNGSYALLAELADHPETVRFGVGLSADEIDRQSASCVDELVYVVSKPAGFLGWDQWIRDFSTDQRQRRLVGEQPVIASSFVSCADVDKGPHPLVAGVTSTHVDKAYDARTFRVRYAHRETSDVQVYVVPAATGRPRLCGFTPTQALAPRGSGIAEPQSTYYRCPGQPDVVKTDLLCVQLSREVRNTFYGFYRQCFPQQLEWFATELLIRR